MSLPGRLRATVAARAAARERERERAEREAWFRLFSTDAAACSQATAAVLAAASKRSGDDA